MNEGKKSSGLETVKRWLTWLWAAFLIASLPITYYRFLADESEKGSIVGGLALQLWGATKPGPEAVVGLSIVALIIAVFFGKKAKKPPVQEQDEPELDFSDEELEAQLPRPAMQRPPQESSPPAENPPPPEKKGSGWGLTVILVAVAVILFVTLVLPSGSATPTAQQPATTSSAVRNPYTIMLIAIITTVIFVVIAFVAGWVYQWPVPIKVGYMVNLGRSVRNPATVKVTVLVKRIFTAEGILNYLRLSGARKDFVGEKLVASVERGEIRGLEWITSRIMAAINSISNLFEMETYRSGAFTIEETLLDLLKKDTSLTKYGLAVESVSWGDIGESQEIQSAQAEMTAAELQSRARAALATGNISGIREFLKGLEGSPELSSEQMYELVRIITQGDVNKDIARSFGAGLGEALAALLSSSRSSGGNR